MQAQRHFNIKKRLLDLRVDKHSQLLTNLLIYQGTTPGTQSYIEGSIFQRIGAATKKHWYWL